MIKKALAVLVVGVLFVQLSPAQATYEPTELIDTPTARSVDFGSYLLVFRLYGTGSVIGRLQYGIIMKNLTLGLSLDAENMVGQGDISVRRPYLYGKIPLYSGDHFWPALSFGFDEQGYGNYSEEETYQYDPIGFFVVASKYGFLPGMNLNLGMNSNQGLPSAENEGVTGFAGIDYLLGPEFMALAELRDIDEFGVVVNLGVKYLLSPELSFEFNLLDVGAEDESNRILKVFYRGDF